MRIDFLDRNRTRFYFHSHVVSLRLRIVHVCDSMCCFSLVTRKIPFKFNSHIQDSYVNSKIKTTSRRRQVVCACVISSCCSFSLRSGKNQCCCYSFPFHYALNDHKQKQKHTHSLATRSQLDSIRREFSVISPKYMHATASSTHAVHTRPYVRVCVCLQCIFAESRPSLFWSRIGGKCAANVDVKLINDDGIDRVCNRVIAALFFLSFFFFPFRTNQWDVCAIFGVTVCAVYFWFWLLFSHKKHTHIQTRRERMNDEWKTKKK